MVYHGQLEGMKVQPGANGHKQQLSTPPPPPTPHPTIHRLISGRGERLPPHACEESELKEKRRAGEGVRTGGVREVNKGQAGEGGTPEARASPQILLLSRLFANAAFT